MKKRPVKGKVERKRPNNEWTSIFIGIIIPVFITVVFRYCLFPHTAINPWASGVLLVSVTLLIVGRYTPMKSIDVAIVAFLNIAIIASYLLHYIFDFFIA